MRAREGSRREGGPPASPGDRRRPLAALATVVPVVAFLAYALAGPGLPRGDVAGVYATAAAIVERGGFAIDGHIAALAPLPQTAGASPGSYREVAYAAGHYYHAAPPGRALLAAPIYALGLAFAPILGPEAPAILIVLLGPLLGALTLAAIVRRYAFAAEDRAGRIIAAITFLAIAVALLPWTAGPTVPIVAAAVIAAVAPVARRLRAGEGGAFAALGVGLNLGALALVNYVVGAVALIVLGFLVADLASRERRVPIGLLIVAGAVPPLLLLAAWQTLAFGLPWRLAFRFAPDPMLRPLAGALGLPGLAALLVGMLMIAATRPRLARGERWRWLRRNDLDTKTVLAVVLIFLGLFERFGAWRATALPIRWWSPAPLATVLVGGALLAVVLALRQLPPGGWRPRAVSPLLLALLLVAPMSPSAASRDISPIRLETDGAANYAAPFAIETAAGARELWRLEAGSGTIEPLTLRLDAGARAVAPWVEAWPGVAYEFRAAGNGPLRAIFAWEDQTRGTITTHTASFAPGGERRARFAAPPGAAGLRLRLEAPGGAATVADARLELVGGARVEPFPDGARAALAFSFDWESAMGGLIHSRSGAGEGEGLAVGLRADGGPAVAEAEEKGLRMREGARFLAGLFAGYGIRATFYSTGYNLLDGNPACRRPLGDPIYRNHDAANGWGSDWWRTHPWYGDDPCATEAQAPAWYFAAETRALAAAGHEIASHSFGHLYVRGVAPDELAADLGEWNRAATALGLPPARSFAFPWTSSNSLDDRFWAVFERLGLTILTRLYQTQERPLPHPYELDRIAGRPGLVAFPDFYLPSKADAEREAIARIDQTLAVRGYHSIWNHPNEAIEQGGQIIWSRVVAHAAASRARGLWVAPVSEVAGYGLATRDLAVTALPVASGTRLTIENRSGRALDGVTLALPDPVRAATGGARVGPDGGIILPPLAPGAQIVVVARR